MNTYMGNQVPHIMRNSSFAREFFFLYLFCFFFFPICKVVCLYHSNENDFFRLFLKFQERNISEIKVLFGRLFMYILEIKLLIYVY